MINSALLALFVLVLLNGCSNLEGGSDKQAKKVNQGVGNNKVKENTSMQNPAYYKKLVEDAIASGEFKPGTLDLSSFDLQGHRGARGLLPENTLAAFEKALEYGVRTIECDLVVSRDLQIVVSHDPWMSYKICSYPDGRPVTKSSQADLMTYWMDYDSIRAFDCGLRGNAEFPEQVPMPSTKPLMRQMFDSVDAAALKLGRPLPFYNLEMKSKPSWEGVMVPRPSEFAELVIEQLHEADIINRCNVQSFELKILREVHQREPRIPLAILVYDAPNYQTHIDDLGFKPDLFSPEFQGLNTQIVNSLHALGIKVIPWTVNDPGDMLQLISMGVDGLITDYPDRAAKLLEELGGR